MPSGTFTTFNFLTYGTTAVVVRATGAGQQERAARLAAQALWVSLAIGVALLVVSEAVADPLLRALGRHGRSGHFTFDANPSSLAGATSIDLLPRVPRQLRRALVHVAFWRKSVKNSKGVMLGRKGGAQARARLRIGLFPPPPPKGFQLI